MSWDSLLDAVARIGASLAAPAVMLAPTVALLAIAVAVTSLLRRVLDASAIRAGGTGSWAFLVLHAPGNVFHELAHATGFLVAGYRIDRIRFFFNDDQGGGGYCRSGAPWAPWANPPLRALLAASAPLILGSLGFAALLWSMGIDPGRQRVGGDLPTQFAGIVPHLLDQARALGDTARRIDPGDGRTWALGAAAFLLGAHMLPSTSDLAGILFALATVFLAAWLGAVGSDQGPAWLAGFAATLRDAIVWVLVRVNALIALGIACCAAALVVSLPLVALARAGRRS